MQSAMEFVNLLNEETIDLRMADVGTVIRLHYLFMWQSIIHEMFMLFENHVY